MPPQQAQMSLVGSTKFISYLPEELPFIGRLSIMKYLLSNFAHLKEALTTAMAHLFTSFSLPYRISSLFGQGRISYKIKMSKYKKPVELSIPDSYELGFCTVGKLSQFPFTIFNPNAKPLSYLFKFTQFAISPSKGVLMPNSYSSFRVEFKTAQASVTVGTVVLEVEGEEQRVIKLSAVGKYPYISVNQAEVDFGNVLVTKSVSRELVLKNSSEVPAEFYIQKSANEGEFNDQFITFEPERSSIPPKMSYSVKVNYAPSFVDCRTINNFTLICNNGNQLPLNLRGNSKRFNVYFNTSSINFGEIKLQNTSTKVLTITNDSQLQTDFQFYTDSNNIFLFNDVRGTLGRNSTKKIVIEFRPRNTIAYYERIYCLIRNHLLLYVDLIGTCYDLLIRPVPLMQVHVDTFRKRVIQGRISAIQLKYIENNILLKLAKRGSEEEKGTEENFYQSNIQVREHPYILQKELFLENQKNQLISISHDHLDFGFCDVMTLSSQKEIEVTNRLQSKLNLTWIIQKKENLNGEYMTVFQVYPQSAVLKPNVPVRFTVTFRPLKNNNYYFQHLQFYAVRQNTKITKKTLQEFQYRQLKAKPESTLLRNVKLNQTIQSKVKDDIESTEVLPPLSGVVRCAGHSFSQSSLPFLPIMKMLPQKVTFKPCLKNHSVYDSVELVNQSDTPIYYKFGADPQRVFRAHPKIGLIQPKGFAIVALQFSPKEYKLYKSSISISLNDLPGSGAKLNLVGICTQPDLKLQNEGRLYFAPTFTGVCTKKDFRITNLSKTKITYRVNIPEKYQEILSFQPAEKQLEANEEFTLNAFFIPQQKRQYKINVPIEAIQDVIAQNLEIGYHNPGSATSESLLSQNQARKVFNLQVNGEGSDGSITISQEEIDFKTVKITEQKKLQVVLKNTSNCAFFVDIHFRNNKFQEGYVPPSESQIASVFGLDFKEGTLPANSELTLGIFFSPNEVQRYDLKLVVSAREKIPKNTTLKLKGNEPTSKCEMRVLAEGNYPLMEIIDIRNDVLSVAALWENFQISRINKQLGCKLDGNEKKYLAVETLTFSEAKSLENSLKHYDWNLGYVSTKNKAKPRKVLITVRNHGGTPLDYVFKFPSDNKVEEELWADPGEPTDEEAYEKAIIENNIFQIKPKVGRLEPNEVKDIELIYSPVSLENVKLSGSSNEIHFLKVVFQIKNGKSLVFNLKGTTLGPNEGLLTVKKSHYILPETPIGLLQPLRFPIQLNNVGSIKVNYKTQIKYEPGEFQDVFKIQNPNYHLISGENHYLYCLYKPLIQKRYRFVVYVHVYDFNKEIQVIQLQLEGQGIREARGVPRSVMSKPVPGQRTTVSEIGSKVFFSIQEIDFEEMNARETKYRMIILYNMSKDHALGFDFPTQSNINPSKQGLTCGDKFTIEPCQGNLQPSKFIQLKLILTSSDNPSFYQGEIPCHITWASNKYSTQDNDVTQKDVIMTAQKQSLFLQLKKTSNLTIKSINDAPKFTATDPKKSLLDNIFQSIFSSALNDRQMDDLLEKLEKEDNPLLDMLDTNQPIGIGCTLPHQLQTQHKKDYSNHEYLLLNDQFIETTQIIMENTFFNIVQETTHQENDFLRVGKKFIQANKL